MPYKSLEKYLPEGTYDYIEQILEPYYLKIKITNPRQTRNGSFRAYPNNKQYYINITGTLNQYSFIITFLHEVAHLKTWEKHKVKAKPHGKEWKAQFQNLIFPLLLNDTFPPDIRSALIKYFENPKASGNSDLRLARCLKKYDTETSGKPTVEEIPENSIFVWRNGKTFKKQEKLRKRYKCIEVKTKKIYLFDPLAEVVPVRQ